MLITSRPGSFGLKLFVKYWFSVLYQYRVENAIFGGELWWDAVYLILEGMLR